MTCIEEERVVCFLFRDANSTEIDPDTPHPVVVDMPEHTQGDLGGTMRLGKRATLFSTENSVMRKLYGSQVGSFCVLIRVFCAQCVITSVWKNCNNCILVLQEKACMEFKIF